MNDKKKNQTNYRKGISSNVYTKNTKNVKNNKKEKEGFVICKGVVIESYPNTRFLVELENTNTQINATLAGKLRQHYIKILVGDRVEVELSIYDITQGRISKRI